MFFGDFAALAKEQGSALRGGLLCPWRLVVAKSTPLRFRLAAKTAFVPLLLLFPANPLRWASPGVTRDWQNAAGDAADGHFVLIVAFPRSPITGDAYL